MKIEFSKKNTPNGTRFLYKDRIGNIKEGLIREWSPSGEYVLFNNDWLSINELSLLKLIEILKNEDLWKDDLK